MIPDMKTAKTTARIVHPIEPTFDSNSAVLILGSFPSKKSREASYFYAHPQNRFYKVLSGLFGEAEPKTTEERKAFLLRHHIAVFDVIRSCIIEGSSDRSIRDVVPNDLSPILQCAKIRAVFCNGRTAGTLYEKYLEPVTKIPCIVLPSTSPANASYSLSRLMSEWRSVRDLL